MQSHPMDPRHSLTQDFQKAIFQILVVDDDILIHKSIKACLPPQWKLSSAMNIDEIPQHRFFHAACVDMHLSKDFTVSSAGPQLPEPDGPKIVQKLRSQNEQTEIIGISGDMSIELMEKCLKAGAQRFLSKPILQEELLLTLEKIEALWKLRTHQTASNHTTWIGNSPATTAIQKRIAELKSVETPVLIEGETGTGKEVVASLLHRQEGSRPWVPVNLGAIAENLFESEFFGHVKGAFTGADQNKIGLVEAANGGDLFLDEIEALPLVHQAKLLRFLENGEVKKVGAKETSTVQVRVIAASNVSLKDLVSKGEFREDLYYRLCANTIQLPPLRDRSGDIEILCQHFFSREKIKRTKSFSPEAIEALKKYTWPGNVRELKRICEQLYLTSPLPIIRKSDVDAFLGAHNYNAAFSAELQIELGLDKLVEEFETKIIKKALEMHNDVERAAEALKVSRSNLYKKMKDYKINS